MPVTGRKSFFKESLRIKLLIFIVTLLSIVFMFPKGEVIESEVTVGSIWVQNDLIAATSFPVYKNPEVYRLEKLRAGESVLPVFLKNNDILKQSIDSLNSYNSFLIKSLDKDLQNPEETENNTFLSPSSYRTFRNLRSMEQSTEVQGNRSLIKLFDACEDILKKVYRIDILNLLYTEIKKDSIAVRTGREDIIQPKRRYQDLRTVHDFVAQYVSGISEDQNIINALIEYVNHFIRPSLVYSEQLTQEEIKHAQDRISPNIGIVNENERIIAKHDRISEEAKLKIDSYRQAKAEQEGSFNYYVLFSGKMLHILAILSLFAIYLYLFRKKIFYDNMKILMISIIILFICLNSFLIQHIEVHSPIHLLIIIPAASMMLTIIFDSRVAFYGTVIISLIAGGLRGNDYSFTAMNIFAGALAAYTVRDIKNRSQIFRSFFYILIGYITTIFAFGMERYESIDNLLIECAFGASNALISPIFTFGMIIFLERIFNITTELTLLELTDFNRPLLKDLAKNAPGTFTHSITVGSLVERAAEAIGANPLLARVGAYYHDIGKMLSPELFVENQLTNENTHENLNPKDSASLIINHVKRGMELAKKEDLPKEIVDFIPMHHGTLVVSYFYEKAKKLYNGENININEFRYSGPKPTTKETALVMLADACESTVRSIGEPDQAKIDNVITNLIKARVEDGQLDDSPITLNDLKKIKEVFLNFLLGLYHKRIRYPKQEEMENEQGARTV